MNNNPLVVTALRADAGTRVGYHGIGPKPGAGHAGSPARAAQGRRIFVAGLKRATLPSSAWSA